MCSSGQACPQTGYWQAYSLTRDVYVRLKEGAAQRFEANEIMPTLSVQFRQPRFLLPDIITVNDENIEWRLLG